MPIGEGQTISQPYTVAFQSELLAVEPHMKILEIGTGSGYQACILDQMGARVFSVETIKSLHRSSQLLLKHLKCRAKLFVGDGSLGLPSYAPFDRILVTAASPHIPEALQNQIRIGGHLVIGGRIIRTNHAQAYQNFFHRMAQRGFSRISICTANRGGRMVGLDPDGSHPAGID